MPPGSEQITQAQHMHVQAGVWRRQVGVGHVLKAVAEAPMLGKIPVQPNVGSELKIHAKILVFERVAAQQGWAHAAFQRNWPPLLLQNDARPESEHRRVLTGITQPTTGQVQPRLQLPLLAQVPTPRQEPVGKGLDLVELVSASVGGKPATQSCGLKAEILRPA